MSTDQTPGAYGPQVDRASSKSIAVATAAVANRFVESTNMKVGAYTVANSGTMPTDGARLITVTHAAGDTPDTLGTITVVGTNLAGATITEDITPLSGTVASGAKWFRTVTSVTGAGWVIDGAEATNDTLTVGCGARVILAEGDAILHTVNVHTTAAGAITLKDASGTRYTLKASIPEGSFLYDVLFDDFLEIVVAAASDVSVTFYQ